LPLHQNSQGLPIGVMLTANWGEDALLLQLARQLETAYPWPRRAPL
jgi:amidase